MFLKKQKKMKVSFLVMTIAIMITCFAMPVNAGMFFSDLSSEHWCYDKIIDFGERGYVCGYEDGTFRADQTITRAEYVKIVNNFFGYELEWDKESSLKDVSSGDWFYPYVNEAVERGYITGYEDGTFRPNNPIRRQEATVILSRILEIDEEEYPANHKDGLAQYPDGDDVEDWARVAIHSYSVYNFINGYEDGFLRILQDVTRAETVELLHVLEKRVIIPDEKPKPSGGGGGGGSNRVTDPTITVYEMSGEGQNRELVVAEGWVNFATTYEDSEDNKRGALVEITSTALNSTITYTLDNWKTKNQYSDKFVLTDGIYVINAYTSKSYYTDSRVVTGNAKIDTVAPKITGVQAGKEVTLTVTDSLSGVSGDSLKHAWFTSGDNGDYVRETEWFTFINGETVVAPEYPGVYYLGVMGSDIAENKIGTGFSANEPNVNKDDNVDYPETPEKDDKERTDEPFVIVTEIENENDDPTSGDPTESGDKELIIEVVVNSVVTVVHDFDDDVQSINPSGDITTYIEAKPGETLTVNALDSGDAVYAFIKNYEVVEAPKTTIVSRDSGDASNKVTINYERIKVTVTFDKNASDAEGTMTDTAPIPAGISEKLPANTFTRVGYEFVGWSGDNGKTYANEEEFMANPEDKEVTLYAKWNVLSYTVTLISGDNIISVSGDGEYEYGSKVNIEAEIAARPGYSYAFVWSGDFGDIADFDETSANTTFTMPAKNLLFEAIAKESVNTDTPYKVKHWKENIEGGYPASADDTENLFGKTGELATFTPKQYTGFEYSGDLTTPTDRTILGDGSLVINLYYTRNSYDLEIEAGKDIEGVKLNGDGSVLTGTFRYGEEIDISAIVKSNDAADYVFTGWYGTDSIDEFVNSGDTTFEMPAEAVKLTAIASKIDVELSDILIIDFTGSGEASKTAPEPGDEVTYKVTVTNTSDDDVTVNLLLAVNESGEISGDGTVKVEVDKDGSIEITFTAKINPDFPVNKEFGVTVTAKSDSITANGKTLDTATNDKRAEKLSAINFKEKTNKNVVMLIDVSSSMAFCTEHPESTKGNVFFGYIVLSGDVVSGRYTGPYDTVDNMGNQLAYDESGDTIFLNGNIIMDYNQTAAGSWKGHSLDLSSSEKSNRCSAPSRMEVLIESLIARDTGFIDRLKKGAAINGEEITITLVTFSGYFKDDNGNDVIKEGKRIPMAEVVGTFDIDDSTLKDEVERIKYSLHTNTELNTGLEKMVEMFSGDNDLIKDNAENYFIFFGDGLIGDLSKPEEEYRETMLKGLIKGNLAKFDYSYAIGFGKDFDSTDSANPSSGEIVLTSLLKPGDKPIKANSSGDIIEAFASIARNISAIEQTENGLLTIEGKPFDDAVEAGRVFDIVVMNGNDVLFIIEEPTTEEVDIEWVNNGDEVKTHVKFNYISGALKSVDIDLSGTAFSDKKNLNIALDF